MRGILIFYLPMRCKVQGMIQNVNHIALAVGCVKTAANFWHNVLGCTVQTAVPQPQHGVTAQFVQVGNTTIELLQPLGDTSPIANYLQKNPRGGVHHICLQVACIEQAQQRVQAAGVRVLGEPKIGAHGTLVIFLHPADCGGVLIELQQQ